MGTGGRPRSFLNQGLVADRFAVRTNPYFVRQLMFFLGTQMADNSFFQNFVNFSVPRYWFRVSGLRVVVNIVSATVS